MTLMRALTSHVKDLRRPIRFGYYEFPSVKTAAAHFGLNEETVSKRLQKGWSEYKALTTPVRYQQK